MFRVRWARMALDELTTLWIEADSPARQTITAAAHQVDQALQSDPERLSESRSEGRRIMFALPLGVSFRMEPDGRTVSVLHVWHVHPCKQ